MKSKLTVNVAIAAYNAEHNIKRLVESLVKQKAESFVLKHIIVNSDSSADQTVAFARSVKNTHVRVVDSQLRLGFAGVFVGLLQKNDADVMVLLNDDIIITDDLFIEKTITPFLKENNIGLVCSNPQPIPSKHLMENAVISSFNAYEKVRMLNNVGNNVLTCDGKTLTLSKQFIHSLKFPKDLSQMANVDWFIYFSCIKNGFTYRFVEHAKVYFKCPSTIKDYIKWTTRNNTDVLFMKKQFGPLFDESYKIPRIPFLYYGVVAFIKNPIGCLLLFGLSIYCKVKATTSSGTFETKWDLVSTTKDMH